MLSIYRHLFSILSLSCFVSTSLLASNDASNQTKAPFKDAFYFVKKQIPGGGESFFNTAPFVGVMVALKEAGIHIDHPVSKSIVRDGIKTFSVGLNVCNGIEVGSTGKVYDRSNLYSQVSKPLTKFSGIAALNTFVGDDFDSASKKMNVPGDVIAMSFILTGEDWDSLSEEEKNAFCEPYIYEALGMEIDTNLCFERYYLSQCGAQLLGKSFGSVVLKTGASQLIGSLLFEWSPFGFLPFGKRFDQSPFVVSSIFTHISLLVQFWEEGLSQEMISTSAASLASMFILTKLQSHLAVSEMTMGQNAEKLAGDGYLFYPALVFLVLPYRFYSKYTTEGLYSVVLTMAARTAYKSPSRVWAYNKEEFKSVVRESLQFLFSLFPMKEVDLDSIEKSGFVEVLEESYNPYSVGTKSEEKQPDYNRCVSSQVPSK